MRDLRSVDVDEILISLNNLGKYQLIQCALFFFTYFSEAYQSFCIVFLAQANPFSCALPDELAVNQTDDVYGECSISSNNGTNVTSCIHGYKYEEPKDWSIVSDFDLVCDRAALSDFSQTLLNLGMAIGSVILTLASDRFGRKRICVLSHLGCLITGLAAAFAPNYIVYTSLKFINGVFIQGSVLTALTFGIEIFPRQNRRQCGLFGLLLWCFCLASLSLITYAVRMYSWRIVYLTITSISLFALIQYWITDESLRWLIANNRYDDAVKIIHKAAAMNKVSPEKALKLLNQEELQPLHPSKNIDELCDAKGIVDNQKVPSPAAQLTMLDIFKHRRPTCTLFIVWFLWFTNALTYLGIFLTSSSLAGSTYLNFFLNALVEAPSAIFYWFFLDRIGRKKTGIFFHGIAAFGLIIATVLRLYDDDGTITTLATVFSLIGKFGISGSFNVIWNCTPEYFPTNIRNAAFGSANALCRIAGMLAPFSNLLTSQVAWAPGAIFGGCCLVATGLIFFLPETMGKELPQTMEDMEKLYD